MAGAAMSTLRQKLRTGEVLMMMMLAAAVASCTGSGSTEAGSLSFSGPDPAAALFALEVASSFAGGFSCVWCCH